MINGSNEDEFITYAPLLLSGLGNFSSFTQFKLQRSTSLHNLLEYF